jgi:hypothetical protein
LGHEFRSGDGIVGAAIAWVLLALIAAREQGTVKRVPMCARRGMTGTRIALDLLSR